MAITFVRENGNTGNTGSISVVMPGPVAVGDLLVACFLWPGASSNHSPAITDTVNTGAWNFPASLHFANISLNQEIVVGWIRCDAAGTPTINATSVGTDNANLACMQYTGFVNGPAVVAADISTNSGTGTAISAPGFTNSSANELILALITANNPGADFHATVTGGYTFRFSQATGIALDQTVSTAGNAITLGATQPTSQNWGAMIASFQDISTSAAPIAWVT